MSSSEHIPIDAETQRQEQQRQAEEGKRQAEEMRRIMLRNILEPEAQERLHRLALVKPDRAKSAEEYLLRMAQMRGGGFKVDDQALVGLLEQVSQTKAPTPTVKVSEIRARSA
eukprot:GHVU01009093.1.p1 GENE.GHVU01009093.1~~GHVU01009093.1.p1  ORF type:complete len:113 (+),score=18.95 GHVU01009093.1:61-399(+)